MQRVKEDIRKEEGPCRVCSMDLGGLFTSTALSALEADHLQAGRRQEDHQRVVCHQRGADHQRVADYRLSEAWCQQGAQADAAAGR